MGEKGRKTPDELLREVQAEEASSTRGHLKVFLGYASGVGKSFRMLDEARRRIVDPDDSDREIHLAQIQVGAIWNFRFGSIGQIRRMLDGKRIPWFSA
jgi:hypothetical protein